MTTGRLVSLLVAGALTAWATPPTKGTMVQGPAVNAAASAAQETTRATATPGPARPTVIILDPGDGGTGGPTGGGGGPTGGGGTGTGGSGGTGTGGTGTGGTGTGTGTGGSPTPGSIPADGILAQILALNPGDTTPNYPYTPDGSLVPYTGAQPTSDPALTDLSLDMVSVTGAGTTPTPTPAPASSGCVCCGAPVHTELIHDVTPIIKEVEAYIAYQVWHVDHFSGNFWSSYHHSNNTCTGTTVLGDVNGFALPAGTAPVPTIMDPAVGCTVPWGTQVGLDVGPAMPNPFSNPPTVCPQCGRNNDSWGVYPVGTYKVMIKLPVTSTTATDRWAVICANGHDQALPCNGNGLPADPPPPPPPPGGPGGGTGGGKIIILQ